MMAITINNDLILTLLKIEDAQPLLDLVNANRPMLREWLPWLDTTNTVDDQIAFINSVHEIHKSNGAFVLAIRWHGKIVGVVGFHPIDWERKSGPIGYWLGAEAQGKGIITQCVKHLTEYAFSELKLDRVELNIATGNIRSQKVAERLGFQLESTKPNAENLYGRMVDHYVYVKTNPITTYWNNFRTTIPERSSPSAHYISWSFGSTKEMADQLLQLVLDGKKTATCAMLAAYGKDPLPKQGEFNIILDGSGHPACITQTTEVRTIPFNKVDEQFALEEGEGSFEHWRKIHWDYFSSTSKVTLTEDVLIVCERFKVLFTS